MCGRFSLFVPSSILEDRFDVAVDDSFVPRYNVAPGDDVATIRGDAPEHLDHVEWGLIPHWADDPTSGIVNARAETIAEKPSFRDAFRDRRCLVPADGYYEWAERRDGKQPYRITRGDDEPFGMAGILDRREDRETVAIVTTEAAGAVRDVHDRMPAIVGRDEHDTWLHGSPDDASALLDSPPGDHLDAYPVSTAVNDPANDDPSLIEPVDTGRTELGDFA